MDRGKKNSMRHLTICLVFGAEVTNNSDLINLLILPIVGYRSLKFRVSLKVGPEGGRLHVRKALRVHWLMVP